jgi:ATP/ADP translocase
VGLIVSLYEGTATTRKFMGHQLKTSIIVGCFFGCIAAFSFGENLGRRWSLAIGAMIMVVGALLQCE